MPPTPDNSADSYGLPLTSLNLPSQINRGSLEMNNINTATSSSPYDHNKSTTINTTAAAADTDTHPEGESSSNDVNLDPKTIPAVDTHTTALAMASLPDDNQPEASIATEPAEPSKSISQHAEETTKPADSSSGDAAAAEAAAAASTSSPPFSSTDGAADTKSSATAPPKKRLESIAIGPATDDSQARASAATTTTTSTAAAAAPPDAAATAASSPTCIINLLLTSGARHPYKIDERYLAKRNVNVPGTTEGGRKDPFSISVYTLKELILREWREEWDAPPSSPSSIRLIHFGRLLDDKIPLKECRFNLDAPNVVHMTVKPQEMIDEEDGSKGKATGRDRDGAERTPGCRCVIL